VAEVGDRVFTPAGLSDSLSFPGDRDPMLIPRVLAALRTPRPRDQSVAGAPKNSSCLFDVEDLNLAGIDMFLRGLPSFDS